MTLEEDYRKDLEGEVNVKMFADPEQLDELAATLKDKQGLVIATSDRFVMLLVRLGGRARVTKGPWL